MTDRQIEVLTKGKTKGGYKRTRDRGEGPLLYWMDVKGWINGYREGDKITTTSVGTVALAEAKKKARAKS